MKIASFALAFAAAINVAFAAPLTAHAAPTNVQPIPYAPSQPVPVGQPPSQPLPPLPPTTAPVAATGGNDVIVLKGGGMLRGRLIEVIPNDHATISLPTGQNAIVEWSRIDRIEQQQQAAPSVLVQGKTAAAPGPSGMVWIHIDSDHELVLEGRPADGGWSIVCTAPCDTGVPLEYEYRISGSGIRTSHSFRIEGAAGQHVILSVKAGSKAGFVGGIVLASISPVVIVVGLLVALVGAIEQTDDTTLGLRGMLDQLLRQEHRDDRVDHHPRRCRRPRHRDRARRDERAHVADAGGPPARRAPASTRRRVAPRADLARDVRR